MDYSPPGPSVHGILQARILEWVAMSFSKDAALAGGFFITAPPRNHPTNPEKLSDQIKQLYGKCT